MVVDGRGMSAFQDLREWSWIWLLMHPHSAYTAWQFPPYHWQKSETEPNRKQEFRHWCFQCHVEELWFPSIVPYTVEGSFTRESVTKNLCHLYRFSISRVWHCPWFSSRGLYISRVLGSTCLPVLVLDICQRMCFIHVGATDHFSMDAWEYLNTIFPLQCIGHNVSLSSLLAHLMLMYWLFWSGTEWDIIQQPPLTVNWVWQSVMQCCSAMMLVINIVNSCWCSYLVNAVIPGLHFTVLVLPLNRHIVLHELHEGSSVVPWNLIPTVEESITYSSVLFMIGCTQLVYPASLSESTSQQFVHI